MDALESLWAYCRAQGRICPRPGPWAALWALLPDRQKTGRDWTPAPPMGLNWATTSGRAKAERLWLHLDWAAKHGVLDAVAAHLRALPPEDWVHDDDPAPLTWGAIDTLDGLRDNAWWYKIVGMLVHNFAVIDRVDASAWFVGETGGIFDRLTFDDIPSAEAALLRNGFRPVAEDSRMARLAPRAAPFSMALRPVYSSGEYWTP